MTVLPTAFCWTKMGHEAGQSLEAIVARKDAERESGDGLFFWGIGTALGQRVWKFIESEGRPRAFFSPMKAKPKPVDVRPQQVFSWTAYLDRRGNKHPMPEHVFVTSRGNSRKHHYALVCRKNRSLLSDTCRSLDWDRLRNYGETSRLGFSQVTAIVDFKKSVLSTGFRYEISFEAELVPPYYVTLVDPLEVPNSAVARINDLWMNSNCDASQWREWLRSERSVFSSGDLHSRIREDSPQRSFASFLSPSTFQSPARMSRGVLT